MQTLWFYSMMAARDTFRLRRALLATCLIVGICLPLVLLLGLTTGLIHQQEDAMLRSPTACLVSVWATNSNASPFSSIGAERSVQENPAIACVIPTLKKVVDLRIEATRRDLPSLTILSTAPGDPLLAMHHADVLRRGEQALVLSRAAADRLGVRYHIQGDQGFAVSPRQFVTVTVTRSEQEQRQVRATVPFEVQAIVDFGNALLAHADGHVLDAFEDYQQGRAIPSWGWPALAQSAPVAYEGYVCFDKAPLDPLDYAKLAARGMTVARLDPTHPDHQERCSLGGLLPQHALAVYYLTTSPRNSVGAQPELTLTPQDVEAITDADDIVVPWSPPLVADLDHAPSRLVGVSLRQRWLRRYFRDGAAPFELSQRAPEIRRLDDPCLLADGPPIPASGQLRLSSGLILSVPDTSPVPARLFAFPATAIASFPPLVVGLPAFAPLLFVVPAEPALPLTVSTVAATSTSHSPTTIFVPAPFLAHLRAAERGDVRFEAAHHLFVPTPRPNVYYQARVYARTLHDVPTVDALLREAGYTTQSERTRIEEIHGYARTLRLLVGVVGGTVFLFGLGTLVAVLSDNTARKRSALGVLRVLGVSRWGILYFVIARALLIGLLAGSLTIVLGLLLAWGLTTHVAQCELQPLQLVAVFALAVLACLVGVFVPAIHASQIDPVTAILEGQLR